MFNPSMIHYIFKHMLLCLHLLPKRHSNLTYHSRVTATPGNTSALLAVIAVTVLLLLLQGWSQCCERRGPLMSSSWLLSRWAVLHCTAAMLCSIFTHQCSCMSISCATLMHATTVLLISMTKSCHELRPHRASPCMAMAKTYHADKSSGGSC